MSRALVIEPKAAIYFGDNLAVMPSFLSHLVPQALANPRPVLRNVFVSNHLKNAGEDASASPAHFVSLQVVTQLTQAFGTELPASWSGAGSEKCACITSH